MAISSNTSVCHACNSGLKGWINGFIGMIIFSGSLPATRVAVQSFDPFFLTFMRASIAGMLALLLIFALRQRRPALSELFSLLIVALGVVVGFPLLTALALQHVSSAHSIVFIGLLPMSTAFFAVIRGGERPRRAFWFFSTIGCLLVMGFALAQSAAVSLTGDILMLAATLVCGLGYAEGAMLTRHLGGWQVICWSLILSLPIMLLATVMTAPMRFSPVQASAWWALGYVSLFSMLIGFIFWYRGLAAGGIASVGQLQLLQPFFGLSFSALLLHESINPSMLAVTAAVVCCLAAARKFGR
ncbi:TPA: DMT family transporter [Serratia fonticola]|nr:DMT family transporter [Serratia fonticola]